MNTYIIHTADEKSSLQIAKYIKYKYGIIVNGWKNIPTLLTISCSSDIVEALRDKRGVLKIESNSSVRPQENKLYKLEFASETDFNDVLKKLVVDLNVSPFTEDEINMLISLDSDQLKFINDNLTNSPYDLIVSVQEDSRKEFVRTQPTDETNWGLNRIHHKRATKFGTIKATKNGSGVNMFIVDSGILMNHSEFVGRIDQSLSYDAFREVGDPLYGYPDDGNIYLYGVDDHGTHVASIAAGLNVGVAFGSTIIPVRVLSNQYNTGLIQLIDAVDWIIETHQSLGKPSVANMSFIVETPEISSTIEVLTSSLIAAGVILVVSSGNQKTDAFFVSPANAGSRRTVSTQANGSVIETLYDPSIKPIVVSASGTITSTRDTVWANGNYGEVVDIFAPGENIYGASLYYSNDIPDFTKERYDVKTGTSMAAPFVSGVAALYLEQNPSLTNDELRKILIEDSTKNVFDLLETINPRIDYDYFDANGDKLTILNTNVQSPNRMLYIWHVLTNFVWDDFSIEMDEQSYLTYDVPVYCTDYYGEYHQSLYTISDIVDVIPVGINVHTGFELVSENGSYKTYKSPAVLDISTPNLVDNTTSTFLLKATDNRIISYKSFNILVKNVPTPPVWVSPDTGKLLSYNIKKGDILNQNTISFVVAQEDNLPITFSMSPISGALPPGIALSQNGNVGYLEGIVGAIPYTSSTTLYEFVIRATASNGLIAERYFSLTGEYVNEYHKFVDIWLSSLFEIDPVNYPGVLELPVAGQGNSYSTLIEVENPDNDFLEYTIHPVTEIIPGAGVFNGELPTELRIDGNGNLRGIVDPAEELGTYYFIIEVTDPHGYSISQKFAIIVREEISTISDGDQIIWITPSGEIGRLFETYPSYCYVEAKSASGAAITYSLAPGSGDLPPGLELDAETGLIKGKAPLVEANVTYTFTIRARVGSRYVDRIFSIQVIDIYDNVAIMNVRANVTGYQRIDLGTFAWSNNSFDRTKIFRLTDSNFGLPKEQHLYIINGLNTATDAKIIDFLDDYHLRMKLILGPLKTVSVYEPETNKHIYDVVYISIIDQMKKAGGFDNGAEQQLLEVQKNPYDVDYYNENTGNQRYFPNSLENIRQDFINTSDNRDAPGLANNEGLPLWMRSIGGYEPGIILAYAQPGYGRTILNAIVNTGYNEKIIGTIFEVDRYYISKFEEGVSTQFDVVNGVPTTHFDDPDIPAWNNEDFSMYSQATIFDLSTVELGKYYKFPKDDKNILADRAANQHR